MRKKIPIILSLFLALSVFIQPLEIFAKTTSRDGVEAEHRSDQKVTIYKYPKTVWLDIMKLKELPTARIQSDRYETLDDWEPEYYIEDKTAYDNQGTTGQGLIGINHIYGYYSEEDLAIGGQRITTYYGHLETGTFDQEHEKKVKSALITLARKILWGGTTTCFTEHHYEDFSPRDTSKLINVALWEFIKEYDYDYYVELFKSFKKTSWRDYGHSEFYLDKDSVTAENAPRYCFETFYFVKEDCSWTNTGIKMLKHFNISADNTMLAEPDDSVFKKMCHDKLAERNSMMKAAAYGGYSLWRALHRKYGDTLDVDGRGSYETYTYLAPEYWQVPMY